MLPKKTGGANPCRLTVTILPFPPPTAVTEKSKLSLKKKGVNYIMWWTLFIVALAAGITVFVAWVFMKNISVKWYEWLIGALGVLLFVFMLQNFAGTLQEGEPKAAWIFLWTSGIPALIFLAVPAVLVARRQHNG
jgi:uncharacterized membrane protein YfcA